LRGLAKEAAQRKSVAASLAVTATTEKALNQLPTMSSQSVGTGTAVAPKILPRPYNGPMLTAVRGPGRTLDFAVSEAANNGQPLYVLFVREQPVIAPGDRRRKWTEDGEARTVFEPLQGKGLGETIIPCYAISDSPAHTIADLASTIGADRVLLGAPQRGSFIHILRGNIVREVAKLLPDDIHLLVTV
jgi:nucleotide-binding universal stress UspA family protein